MYIQQSVEKTNKITNTVAKTTGMQKLHVHAFSRPPWNSGYNVMWKLAFSLSFTGRAYCIHVHVCTCLFQGEELLSACSAGSTTDVSALLEKGADVHFIGKVKRVNTLLYIETLL